MDLKRKLKRLIKAYANEKSIMDHLEEETWCLKRDGHDYDDLKKAAKDLNDFIKNHRLVPEK
jgi:hypothetical protein